MSFKVSDNMLANIGRVNDSALRIEAQKKFKIDYIPLDKIVPSEKNFYALTDIEELAQSILIDGLQHNISVRQINVDGEDELYELVSGERRFTAYKTLFEQKGDTYKLIPAKIISVDDIDAEVLLIQSNATSRTITPGEVFKQVERLTELYQIKKARGEKVIGKIRDIVANELNMGHTQVSKYQALSKKLDDNLLIEVENGDLTISKAMELAQLPKEQQVSSYHEEKKTKSIPKAEYSQPTGRTAKETNAFRYSYICPSCSAELYSNSIIDVRCCLCDEIFVLGEL